jgi:hypothetical protein
MTKTRREYEDAFESVMEYVELRVGTKHIKNKEDLRQAILDADKHRKDQTERRKISDKFLDKTLENDALLTSLIHGKGGWKSSPAIRNVLKTVLGEKTTPTTIGTSNPPSIMNPEIVVSLQEKANRYREKGYTIITYENGLAAKGKLYYTNRKDVVAYRDLTTGRFISKATVEKH